MSILKGTRINSQREGSTRIDRNGREISNSGRKKNYRISFKDNVTKDKA